MFWTLESQNPKIPKTYGFVFFSLFFNVLGVFPTQFLSRDSISDTELQISIISGIFPKILRNQEFHWNQPILAQILHMGYHFNLVLLTELDFDPKNKKLQLDTLN